MTKTDETHRLTSRLDTRRRVRAMEKPLVLLNYWIHSNKGEVSPSWIPTLSSFSSVQRRCLGTRTFLTKEWSSGPSITGNFVWSPSSFTSPQ